MSVTLTTPAAATIAATNGSASFDAGASPDAIAVSITHAGFGSVSAVTWGGQSMSKVANADTGVFRQYAEVWWLASPGVGGSQTLQLTNSNDARVQVFGIEASGVPTIADTASGDGIATPGSVTLDSGLDIARAIGATWDRYGNSPLSGTTQVDSAYFNGGYHKALSEDVSKSGSRTVGLGANIWGSKAWIAVAGSDVEVLPDPLGMTIGLGSNLIGAFGDANIIGERVRGLTIGLNAPSMTRTAKRQIALVGEGIETPGMTVGGNEGDIATQHANREVTWEPASAHAHGYAGELLITDEPAGTPLVFADILQNESEDDLLYEDVNP